MAHRGVPNNPKNRFESMSYETLKEFDCDTGHEINPRTTLYADHSRSIVSDNQSPDVGFDSSVNPYRGCEHGCSYCYARPTHEYLGFSLGLDFETKIMVKERAPELLRDRLASTHWKPRLLAMSGVTDCYQPIERKLKITRRCLEILLEFRNPVFIITKNHLVTRDGDLLAGLSKFDASAVLVSVTTLSDELCGKLEPRTSRPKLRLEAIRKLAESGIPVGVNVAPIIPGLTDHETPEILGAAREAGASFCGYTIVRLPYGVKEIFSDWLSEHYPDRRDKILHRIQNLRGGKLNVSRFGDRMRGEGPYAEAIRMQFQLWKKKLGFGGFPALSAAHFKRPPQPGEQLLLDGLLDVHRR